MLQSCTLKLWTLNPELRHKDREYCHVPRRKNVLPSLLAVLLPASWRLYRVRRDTQSSKCNHWIHRIPLSPSSHKQPFLTTREASREDSLLSWNWWDSKHRRKNKEGGKKGITQYNANYESELRTCTHSATLTTRRKVHLKLLSWIKIKGKQKVPPCHNKPYASLPENI